MIVGGLYMRIRRPMTVFKSGVPGMDFGYMICETGNMFGGKSEALINRIYDVEEHEESRKIEYKEKETPFSPLKIGAFVHTFDNRYEKEGYIASHSGLRYPATSVSTVENLDKLVTEQQLNVVIIDEVQFFSEKNEKDNWAIVELLHRYVSENRFVIVAGLEKDFRGLPFSAMGDLMAISDETHRHLSKCHVCGEPAILPQRLIEGEPAYEDDPLILVGANDSYQPRCRKCHVLKKRDTKVDKVNII